MEAIRRPTVHKLRENPYLLGSGRQTALGMAYRDAQAVIDGTIERRRVAQKLGVIPVEMAHLFNHVDTLGSIQHFEENARSFQAQIHKREVDVIIPAAAGLQRVAGALLLL